MDKRLELRKAKMENLFENKRGIGLKSKNNNNNINNHSSTDQEENFKIIIENLIIQEDILTRDKYFQNQLSRGSHQSSENDFLKFLKKLIESEDQNLIKLGLFRLDQIIIKKSDDLFNFTEECINLGLHEVLIEILVGSKDNQITVSSNIKKINNKYIYLFIILFSMQEFQF